MTDIHYFKASDDIPEQAYLFALIDDVSRYIIAYQISENKNCDFVASVFRGAIEKVGRSPPIFWSDNGLENLGPERRGIFVQYDIRHIRTNPHKPRINGMIERFWQSINILQNEMV